jgi:hypothetical protein
MGRYKAIIGPRLRARGFSGQQAEAVVGVAILNRMLEAGRPNSMRRQDIAAYRVGKSSEEGEPMMS